MIRLYGLLWFFWHLITLLPITASVSQLKILDRVRAAPGNWNNMIDCRAHWMRISKALVDRLSADSTDALSSQYYFFISIIDGTSSRIPLRSYMSRRSVLKSTPTGHIKTSGLLSYGLRYRGSGAQEGDKYEPERKEVIKLIVPLTTSSA